MIFKFVIFILIFYITIYNITKTIPFNSYFQLQKWHNEITRIYYKYDIGNAFIDNIRLRVLYLF